ncbi:unnamed protein product, partial [Cylicostephanus goldi]
MSERSRRKQRVQDDDELSLESVELDRAIESELLTCCYCQAPLKAIPLDIDDTSGEQRFFWACRNLKTKTCYFPMGLPNNIFWLKRTEEQRKRNYFPRPDIKFLPREF